MGGMKWPAVMAGGAMRYTGPEPALSMRAVRDDAVHVASLDPAGNVQSEDGTGQKPLR